MVIYEVNLLINSDVFSEYKQWLDDHILEMLQFPGFIKATILKPILADSEAHDQKAITIHYELEDAKALETYLTEYAPKMRGDGISRFKGKFSATRRTFEIDATVELKGLKEREQ
jgi:hypothetical protein